VISAYALLLSFAPLLHSVDSASSAFAFAADFFCAADSAFCALPAAFFVFSPAAFLPAMVSLGVNIESVGRWGVDYESDADP